MIKRIFLVLTILLLVACGRPSPAGVYETQGSVDKFKMTLELGAAGQAKLSTRANLGDVNRDRAVEAVMGVPSGRWVRENDEIVVNGARGGDGKLMTHRFKVEPNGNLTWKETGALFLKVR